MLHRIVQAEVNRFLEIGVLFYRYGPERNIAALAYYLQTLSEDGRLTVQDPCKTAEEFFELVRRCLHLRNLSCLHPAERTDGVDAAFSNEGGATAHTWRAVPGRLKRCVR